MFAAIALTIFIALIFGNLRQLFRLGLQQPVQRFLHAVTDQFFDLTLDYLFIKLYNFLGDGLLSPFRMCVATSFYQRSANHVSFYAFLFMRNLLYLRGCGQKVGLSTEP